MPEPVSAPAELMLPITEEQMETKWTPGPWAADYLDKNAQRVVSGDHFEICTCWHHSVGEIEQEMEANALLIAAAPDMAEALQRLCELTYSDNGGPVHFALIDARAALAKAEGR